MAKFQDLTIKIEEGTSDVNTSDVKWIGKWGLDDDQPRAALGHKAAGVVLDPVEMFAPYPSDIHSDIHVNTWPEPSKDQPLRDALSGCVVCGAEADEIFVLCSLCREAVVCARKILIKELIEDIDTVGEMESEVMTHHCGYTKNGSQVHAIGFLGGKSYSVRAACGVRVVETKRRLFKTNTDTERCLRCLGSERV